MSINVAHVKLLPSPMTGSISTYEEMRGYDEITMTDGSVSFTWYADADPFALKIKERVTYPMWRVLELTETQEEE